MRNVAVFIESSTQYGRNILESIARYGQLAGWRLHYEQSGINRVEPEWLRVWDGDGVISHVSRRQISPRLAKRGIAVVGWSSNPRALAPDDIPRIDEEAVGRLGATYFIRKGFRHFAFMGFRDACYSTKRQKAFQVALESAGHEPAQIFNTSCIAQKRTIREKEAKAFLVSLPSPCAVLCATDERAAQILGLASDCGRPVPEQLSILGVDNDTMLCQIAHPPLSSIDSDTSALGTALAERLDQLMHGRNPGAAHPIQPLGVIERVSTALDAVDDPHLIKALAFIRNSPGKQLSVGDVAHAAGLSRRPLEYRFREHFQTSVAAYMRQRKVSEIKELLVHTDFPLGRIAEIVGIEHLQQLHALFRRVAGTSPGKFRRKAKGSIV